MWTAHHTRSSTSEHGSHISQRFVALAVYTYLFSSGTTGDICVLIPRSFSGYIQLYFRHGQPIFLPNLAASMKLVQRYEREAQVIVGDTINHLPARGSEWGGDTLHLAARQGDIFIGYVGEDQKPASEPGLWKKFTGLFHAAPSKT